MILISLVKAYKRLYYYFKNGIKINVAVNKVMACMILYLKILLNKGDFIFAMLANFSNFLILSINRVAVEVAVGCNLGLR